MHHDTNISCRHLFEWLPELCPKSGVRWYKEGYQALAMMAGRRTASYFPTSLVKEYFETTSSSKKRAAVDSQAARDARGEIAADLHNKLKALGHVHAILVLHNDVVSNRLNPATYQILKVPPRARPLPPTSTGTGTGTAC